jgi:hypothetical protein
VKRLLPVLVLIFSLASVAEAAAPSADVSFDGTYKDGRPVEVTSFTYYSVSLACKEGPATASNSGSPLPAMKVNGKGKFKGKFNSGGAKTAVTGRYNRKLTKVRGTLKIKGSYGGYTGCDSGKLKWVTN